MSNAHLRSNGTKREHIRKRLKAIGAPCAICGKPIDYSLDWWVDPSDGKRKRHPYSFEADHVQTLAQGGDPWSFANFQAAHRICNQRKGGGSRRKRPQSDTDTLPRSREW